LKFDLETRIQLSADAPHPLAFAISCDHRDPFADIGGFLSPNFVTKSCFEATAMISDGRVATSGRSQGPELEFGPVSATELDPFPDETLEQVARRHPERIALIHGENRLTFSELDALVAATAADLVEALEHRPLPAGSFVPAVVAHDIASVVIVHAAFRAGVPIGLLDAGLPLAELSDRLRTLGDSGVALVHDDAISELLPAHMTVVPVAREPGRTFDQVDVDPDADATVFFTSGSSGKAKGVVHSTRGCIAGLAGITPGMQVALELGPLACIVPFHWAAGFMMALLLQRGQPMVILDVRDSTPSSLINVMRTEKVALTILPISLAVWLSQNNSGPPLNDLDHLILGGEAVSREQTTQLGGLVNPSTNVEVFWGATEGMSGARAAAIGDGRPDGPLEFRPIDEGSIRLEPSDDGPLPLDGGIVGEIILRGEVAYRYQGQPELTDLRFGIDGDGVRYWRSGDIAEQLPDGTLRLRGRIDDMVKINGKLIEPAESLALLRAFPGVRSVAVLPHTTPSGRVVLVAHVVADDDVSPDAIRRMLMARLPIHVIPGVLMRHDELPLTSRGKVDRLVLQNMQPVAWLESESKPAVSKIETFLLDELRTIIESDQCGVDDDIWFLGLDSLGAMELLTSISEVGFGELSPDVLLDHRTIRSLAERLRSGIDERESEVVTFNAEAAGIPFFCAPGGGGTAIGFRAMADCLSSERPLHVIEARGMHTRDRPDRSLSAMANRVLDVVNERQSDGIVTLIGHSAGGFVVWEAAQKFVDAGRQVRVVLLDTTFVPRTPRIGLNVWGPAPSGLSRLRTFTRAYRSRRHGLRLMILSFRTGRPRADQRRYEAFQLIMARALQRSELRKARFPALYLAAENPTDLDAWKAVDPELEIRIVEGDHSTMLLRPNIDRVLIEVKEWIDRTIDPGRN
jgi:acyl-coenzyme A synthetase/AMP-(fatty) acid ligase/thioesterase domain-containing protein